MQNADGGTGVGVRVVTGAPELEGVGASVGELARRGVVFSLGHRCAPHSPGYTRANACVYAASRRR